MGKQTKPEILDLIGVLIFVDKDIFEAVLVLRQNFRLAAQQVEAVEQQVTEIAGIERFQPVLIEPVEMLALAICIGFVFARIEIAGPQPLVLPAINQRGEQARREALVIDAFGLDQLFEQAKLVVGVDDREI